jgi:hypothetical protein
MTFVPLLEELLPLCPSIKHVVLMTDMWVGGGCWRRWSHTVNNTQWAGRGIAHWDRAAAALKKQCGSMKQVCVCGGGGGGAEDPPAPARACTQSAARPASRPRLQAAHAARQRPAAHAVL